MIRARRVVALALFAALTAGVAGLAGHVSGNRDRAGSSPTTGADVRRTDGRDQAASSVPTVGEEGARIVAAQNLLKLRSQAVKARDKRMWMATVDLPGSSFGKRQSVEFDNLIKLPLGQFAYGTVQLAPALDVARVAQLGSTAWVASVPGTYSLAGYDRAPRAFGATYTLVRRSGGWRIADDTDGVTAPQLWDLPGLRVLRGRFAIVLGNAPEARMREYESIADSAVRRVTGVWGSRWNTSVVILTPSTTTEFAGLVDRSVDKGLDQVAAITQGDITPGEQAQGDRVVINPNAFTALDRNGRNVVIAHELTHVATRSSTRRPVPVWLSEGMADYVGYYGLDLSRARIASELLTLVRQGSGPKALPTADDFDPAKGKIATSYSASWLAVSRLVDSYGQAKVVSFYRAISDRMPVDGTAPFDPDAASTRAFSQTFGVSEAGFVAGWLRYLRTLAQVRG
ncbi:MAG: hypothetical protein ABI438_00230 [Dermatophilaceae bacterium]